MTLADLVSAFGLSVPAAQAHEKWFITPSASAPPLPAEFLPGSAPFTAAVLLVVAAVVIGLLLDRRFERSATYAWTEARLRRLRDFAPGTLAVAMAVLLFWSSWHGVVLADEYAAPAGWIGTAYRVAQAAIGAMLLIGFDVASAAAALGLLYLSLFVLTRSIAPLDYLYVAGIAVFLRAFARGRYSLDWFYGKPVLSTPDGRKRAYLALRVLMGLGMFSLALVKWLRPDVMFAMLDAYADWNPLVILGWAGLPMPREIFVLCLATVETIAAAYVALGLFTRAVAVMLMPVFTVSVVFLGPLELIGHLPILGVLFVLFIYGDTYRKASAPSAPAPLP
jgi:uncharacterized membrane protein YphA (DoxX/SURF4 family)